MKIILETPHLVLRTFTKDDTEMLLDLNQDAKVMAFTGEPPYESMDDANKLLHQQILQHQYKTTGYGFWAAHLLKNGLFIGWCGLKKVNGDVYLDCRLRKRFWNKGYATELSSAVLEYAFTQLEVEEVLAKAHEKNLAAVEVMNKIGLDFIKTKKVKRQRFVTYGITQQTYKEKFVTKIVNS